MSTEPLLAAMPHPNGGSVPMADDPTSASIAGMSTTSVTQSPPDIAIDVVLRDGSTVHVRPVAADDVSAIHAFFDRLSLESIGLRFFGMPSLDWVTRWAVDVDYADRYALVATTGPEHTIVAHGAYIRIDADRAEVAFVVTDAWQGHGIATILLGELAAVAKEHGIVVFKAEVLPYNHRMIEVFRDSGFPVQLQRGEGVIEVEFPTSLSDEALQHFERHEHASDAQWFTAADWSLSPLPGEGRTG